jgi:hypothetical protein
MAISYNIYANDGQGGLVNYETPIASTTELTWTVEPLAFPSDHLFGVRACDTTSGIEEANTEAQVRIVLDSSGNDVTSQPNAVVGLSATATSGGTCWVSWGYAATAQGGSPSGFTVKLTEVTSPLLAIATSTVAYQAGVSGYGCTLTGLSSNTQYSIAVTAIGASNNLPGPSVAVGLDYRVAALSSVDCLVAIPMA